MNTYEQKYKSALEWMRSIYPTMQGADKEDAEHYFPELKESEDERIRKAIICGMNALKEQHKETFASIPINDCIAWLEKQGDKVDVLDDFPTEFERQISHLIASSINKEWEYKKDFVKHTANALLQYAKNELEKQGEQKPTQKIKPFEAEHGKYYYCIKDYFCGGKKQASKGDVIQALRGLPIMGLKDVSEYFLPVNNIQKPTWSEEDEEKKEFLISILEVNHPNGRFKVNPINTSNMEVMSTKELVNWLKSLKPNHWKPSEEQMKALNAINIFGELSYVGQGGTLVKLYNDLKKL